MPQASATPCRTVGLTSQSAVTSNRSASWASVGRWMIWATSPQPITPTRRRRGRVLSFTMAARENVYAVRRKIGGGPGAPVGSVGRHRTFGSPARSAGRTSHRRRTGRPGTRTRYVPPSRAQRGSAAVGSYASDDLLGVVAHSGEYASRSKQCGWGRGLRVCLVPELSGPLVTRDQQHVVVRVPRR